MKNIVLLTVAVLMLSGCAQRNTLYQQWGNQLSEMSGQNSVTKEDISMILGTEPSRCEKVASSKPAIGVFVEKNQLIIKSVRRDGPADQAGLIAGDVIKKIDDQPTTYRDSFKKIKAGVPVQIETSRGIFTVTPDIPDTEQCYWEVRAGQISNSQSGAYFNGYGGVSNSGSSAFQRFFRASCRFQDGLSVGCQSNWQG